MNSIDIDEMMQYPQIAEIIKCEQYLEIKNFLHHGKHTRFEHCLEVADLTFKICKKKGYDFISGTRGALLHDFFFYNWFKDKQRLHNFRHPKIAYNNATDIFNLNKIEKDCILRHMWPLTPKPPRYPESRVVCFADKTISLRDCKDKFKNRFNNSTFFNYMRRNQINRRKCS